MRSGQAVVCVGVVSTLLLSVTSAARANFVDDFLAGYGFCSADGPHYGNGSAFEIDQKAPFGKPAGDWTDSDLAHLHDAFRTCHSLMLQSGRRHEPMNYQELEATIPKIIAQARFELRQKAEDRAAAERQTELERQRRADAMRSARAEAEASQKLAEIDRAAAQKETEAAIARDQALLAAAHARRDAAIARQKTAAMEAEVKAAEAEATKVESAKPSIPARSPPDIKESAPLANEKRQDDVDPEYRVVTVTDLQLDGDKMVGEKVIVRGFVNVFADQGATIYRNEDDMNGIDLHLESGDESTRRYIIEHCGRLSHTCRMNIKATVIVNNAGRAELDLE